MIDFMEVKLPSTVKDNECASLTYCTTSFIQILKVLPPPPCRYLIAKILVKPRALLVYGFAFKAFQNSQSWPYLHSYSTNIFM